MENPTVRELNCLLNLYDKKIEEMRIKSNKTPSYETERVTQLCRSYIPININKQRDFLIYK